MPNCPESLKACPGIELNKRLDVLEVQRTEERAERQRDMDSIKNRFDKGQDRFRRVEENQAEQKEEQKKHGEMLQEIHTAITKGKGGLMAIKIVGAIAAGIAAIAIAIKEWVQAGGSG
jgi:hypothetical protein